jgi:hypothetical protein
MTTRTTLPQRRYAETFELRHGDQRMPFSVTVGYYVPGGAIGEVFIHGSKSGTAFEAVARDGAILLSLALQHGVPLETIKHAITREHDGSPSTIVGAVVDRLTASDGDVAHH